MRSEDGFEWSFVGDVPIGSSPPDSACVWPTTSGYLQVGGVETLRGYDGATGTSVSVDGTDWSSTQTLLGFELELDGVAVLGGTVILDGFQSGPDLPEPAVAAQLLSIDGGATWAPTSGWPSTTVVTDGQVIVAVGDGGWIATLPEALQAG